MNAIPTSSSTSMTQTHPMVLVAAVAVTLASAIAVASMTGWLPHHTPVSVAENSAPAVTSTEPVPPVRVTQNTDAPARKPAVKVGAGGTAPRSTSSAPVVAHPSSHATEPGVVSQSAAICRSCGIVESIEEIPVEGKAGPVGAIAGGVVGSVIGNQIGSGSTRTAARLIGMAGGAYIGHQVEKSNNTSVRYDVVVGFEDGTTQRFPATARPTWRAGDAVKLQNGTLIPRS